LNPENDKKDAKKNNLLAIDSSGQIESSSDGDEKITYTLLYKYARYIPTPSTNMLVTYNSPGENFM